MNRLVRAELLEARTTRTTQLTVLAGIAFAAFLGFANSSIAGDPGFGRRRERGVRGRRPRRLRHPRGGGRPPRRDGIGRRVPARVGDDDLPHHPAPVAGDGGDRSRIGTRPVSSSPLMMVVAAAAVAFPIVLAGGDSIELFHRSAATTVFSLLITSALLGGLGAFLGTVPAQPGRHPRGGGSVGAVLEVVVDARRSAVVCGSGCPVASPLTSSVGAAWTWRSSSSLPGPPRSVWPRR